MCNTLPDPRIHGQPYGTVSLWTVLAGVLMPCAAGGQRGQVLVILSVDVVRHLN